MKLGKREQKTMTDDDEIDAFDAMANMFRNEVFATLQRAQKVTLFREMKPDAQLESLVAGVFSAVLMICFDVANQNTRDEVMDLLGESLLTARDLIEQWEKEAAEEKDEETGQQPNNKTVQ